MKRRKMKFKGVAASFASALAGTLIGRQFSNELAELNRAPWMSPDDLRARSDERLAPLLCHAAENVPFYRETYRRLGIGPSDLRQVEDLRRLPIVTKADHCCYPPADFLADNVPAYLRIADATSGSTGPRFEFYLDRKASPILMANHTFADAWYGMGPIDRSVRVRVPRPAANTIKGPEPFPARIRRIVSNSLRHAYESWTQEQISAWEVGSPWAESIYRRMESHHPEFVTGYTSAVASIADELLKRNLRLSRRVRGVITEAEPLTPSRSKLIADYFNAPIGSRLGIRELGGYLALSCPEVPKQFHVISDHVITEIVLEDGTPAKPGESGRLIVTDLNNYAMPFIRYDTGDLAIADDELCDCGRGSPVIKQIVGRSSECLRTRAGKVISPVSLSHYLVLFHDYGSVIRHYQLVGENEGHLRLLVVPAPKFDSETQQRLESDLSQLLGQDMSVVVEVVPEISCEQSGKRPIIKLAKRTVEQSFLYD
jgi:phenylacetate-CoA ligase